MNDYDELDDLINDTLIIDDDVIVDYDIEFIYEVDDNTRYELLENMLDHHV